MVRAHRLWVLSLGGTQMGGNQSMLLSHIDVSLYPLPTKIKKHFLKMRVMLFLLYPSQNCKDQIT